VLRELVCCHYLEGAGLKNVSLEKKKKTTQKLTCEGFLNTRREILRSDLKYLWFIMPFMKRINNRMLNQSEALCCQKRHQEESHDPMNMKNTYKS
jgi:hypothetical protein